MGFSRQEFWSGLPFPTPEDLPNPGIKPTSLMSPALAEGFFTTSATWEAPSREAWNQATRALTLEGAGSGFKSACCLSCVSLD